MSLSNERGLWFGRITIASLSALLVAHAACTPGGSGGAPPVAEPPVALDGGADAGPSVDRGPRTFDVAGDPNGLAWDAAEGVLYVADDDGNRILSLREGTFGDVIDLPTAPASGPGLGQLLVAKDGTFVVPRFGHGTAGDVVVVPPGEAPSVVPGLDLTRRRIGLAEGPDGRLFVGFFTGGSGERVGAVAVLDVGANTEDVVVSGFKKVVGVLADADGLLVADQDVGEVIRVPYGDPTSRTVVARISSPDLMAWGPEGSFFVGSRDGNVSLVDATGAITRVPGSFREVRGLAYDAAARRLFVVDHDSAEHDRRHLIHVVPVD